MRSIIIADDHPFSLLGNKTFVEGLGYEIVDLCNNGISAYNSIITKQPDIALLDLAMPGLSGIDILEKLSKQKIKTRVILLTMHNENSIFNRAKDLGVSGYLLKEFATDELDICLKKVLANERWFTNRLNKHLNSNPTKHKQSDELSVLSFTEKKVIHLIAEQHTSKEIAKLLFISEKTVETHRTNIINKLQLPKEKNALLMWAMKNIKCQ